MYTILMNQDKSLITTVSTTLYQREKLVDKIQFLFSPYYESLDLSTCTAVLKYVDQGNVAHAETLVMDSELYKDKLRCTLPVDTNLTRFAGDIKFHITFTKVDMETKTQYVLHTSESTITISPLSDYYHFVPDESLEFVDQIVGSLEAKIQATEQIAAVYDAKKADNIAKSQNGSIYLTANGAKIGNEIKVIGDANPDEFTVVEF